MSAQIKLDETKQLVDLWIDWIREQQFDDLIQKDQLLNLIDDVAEDDDILDGLQNFYIMFWGFGITELREESRSVREVIGDDLSETVIEYVRQNEPDEETVRILFRNNATESMFGKILYEGITEFLSRVDIVSKLLDPIPLIGGIKGKIEDNFPEGVKSLLEGRVKEFLGNFSGAAAEQAMNYVLSPDHVDDFCKIQSEVVDHILDKPVYTLLPEDKMLRAFRENLWTSFQYQINRKDEVKERINRFMQLNGDRDIGQFIPENKPESARFLFALVIEKFLQRESVRKWFHQHVDEPDSES